MRATQYKAGNGETAGHDGCPDSGQPETAPGRASRQAALLVTQKASHNRLEQILEMERVAANRALSDDLRKVAEDELESIRNGGAVDPSYQRVKAAQRVAELMKPDDKSEMDRIADEVLANAKADRARRIKENRAKREAAAANIKRSTRSFALKWAELDGWSRKYDAEQIAREMKPDDWALFLRVLDETNTFAETVTLARNSRAPQS